MTISPPKKTITPATLSTLFKVAELHTTGSTTTCDFQGESPHGRGRIEYSKRYNPSKRGYFKGITYEDGTYADLD